MRGAAALMALLFCSAQSFAIPPPDHTAVLRRGINITGWFRYPASRDPASLRSWISDAAIIGLRNAGFTFVRLAVDPAVVNGASMRRLVVEQIGRLRRHGLAVVVSPHPVGATMETNSADRARLMAFWSDLAPELRDLTPAMIVPEILNEPVFRDDPAAWSRLQQG